MDGLFLVYLMGICGSPGPTPLAERPIPVVAGPAASASTIAVPSSPGTVAAVGPDPAAERPVPTEAVATIASETESSRSGENMSKAEVVELVRRKSSEIRHCYEVGLVEDATYKGTVEVGWKIDLGGHVVSANLVSATQRKTVCWRQFVAGSFARRRSQSSSRPTRSRWMARC